LSQLDRTAGDERDYRLPIFVSDGSKRRTREPVLLSPLRFPGSKRQMVPLVVEILRARKARTELFVEPFAGGASVALQLASWGEVDSVILADIDPLIYSFWRTATQDSGWLADVVLDIEVSLPMWQRMRSWEPTRTRDSAVKCLFLNRTSFSGILHEFAGPLGGKSQQSRTIDCRFPRETLARRILQVGALAAAGKIEAVWPYDYRESIAEVRRRRRRRSTVLFLDPPFYAKSQLLYRYAFDHGDHRALASVVRRMKLPYILSYDLHPQVTRLYNGTMFPSLIAKEYRAAASPTRRTATELIVTNIVSREAETGDGEAESDV
jgi:DNA adenine methylase